MTLPARVDRYDYWSEPPPVPSPRLTWWLDRIIDEGWTPNRRLAGMGYDESAEFHGVYMWEWLHVLYPALGGYTLHTPPSELRVWLDSHGIRSDWVPDEVAVPASCVTGSGSVGWTRLPEVVAEALGVLKRASK